MKVSNLKKGQVYSFSVSGAELVKEFDNSTKALVRVKVCHDGNNLHGYPISLEAMKNAESSILGSPLLVKYSSKTNDFQGHELDQNRIGYFVENNNLQYKYDEDVDKTYFYANAVIWKTYAQQEYEVFLKNPTKKVSMEIVILELDDETNEILTYAYQGVTVLGDAYQPACEGAEAKVIKFDKEKAKTEKYLKEHFGKKDDNIENSSREGDNMKLKFNKKEFAKVYEMTVNELQSCISEALSTQTYEYKTDEENYEMRKYWFVDFSKSYVFTYNEEAGKHVALKYQVGEKNAINIDFEKEYNYTFALIVDDEDVELNENIVQSDSQFFTDAVENKVKNAQKEKDIQSELEEKFNKEKENLVAKDNYDELSEKYNVLENKNKEFSTDIEKLQKEIEELTNTNTELQKYKADKEEQEKEQQVAFAISEVQDVLSAEEIKDWKEKSKTFDIIDEFKIALKAFAYDKSKNIKKKDNPKFSADYVTNIPKVTESQRSIWCNTPEYKNKTK